uniref:Uncharacterized protein n=1 Tax=Lates calcarifer TaxID=8187 RepID=A0A4W6GAQ8_LATCA
MKLSPFYRYMIKKMSPSENEFDIPAKNCHRMVILGSTKVGKTAIISRFLNERFDDQYTPTIEDFHRKFYSIKGDVYQLDILDTSGNHPFPAMRRLSILTGELSFQTSSRPHRAASLQTWITGTPSRRRTWTFRWSSAATSADRDFYREVQEDEIEQLVGGDDHCAYFEISAKKNTNVDQMFQTLFTMAKLPNEMSPDRHCKVSLQYCEVLHRKSFRNKKCKDGNAYGIVAPFARRPSVHSDLMYIKEKAIGGSQAKEKGCIIC